MHRSFIDGFEKKAWSIPQGLVAPVLGGAIGSGVGAVTADEGSRLKGALKGGALGAGVGLLHAQGRKGFDEVKSGLVEASRGHRMPWDKM